MSKVLVIKANPKSDKESKTFQLLNAFLDAYKNVNPNDVITTLDLYKENLKPLDNAMLSENEVTKRYASEFAKYDKYIIAAPMWNLASPAIVKMYFDYVTITDITFKYTDKGPVGLLADKPRKVLHIVTRGGGYTSSPSDDFEMGDRFLRAIFAFFGIKAFQTLELEMTEVLPPEQLEITMEVAKNRAKELSKTF